MRITRKGQVTIPIEIRERVGLLPNTEVDFEIHKDGVYLRKAKKQKSSRGSRLIARMRGTSTVKLTTDQIMALTRGK